MKVFTARSINDVLDYFGYISNGKLSQELILISTLTNCQMAHFVNFEAIYEFDQNIKNIQGKLPGLSQQSTLAGNLEPIQFDIPQTKSPMQSSLVSQSPSLNVHGLALEQQDHTFSQSVH